MEKLNHISELDSCIQEAGDSMNVCGSGSEVENSTYVHSVVGETSMALKSKRVNSKPDGKADRYVLKESDYELIVSYESYLEEPDNFAALFGSGGKTKIGGKHQTKTTTFAIMSVQLRSLGFPPCSAANLYKKVNCYRSHYESVLSILKQTGSGLTDEEIVRGLTLEAKLNKACPFFYRNQGKHGSSGNM
ncbi:hypothetical protein R1flu_009126 [Riccia fluitans]|uniref:LAGLIDADG homing endonuclease n=1 Tax=Riccia fluitans TaxID=41844 RepID=A0ABD1Z3Q1_9MARC